MHDFNLKQIKAEILDFEKLVWQEKSSGDCITLKVTISVDKEKGLYGVN